MEKLTNQSLVGRVRQPRTFRYIFLFCAVILLLPSAAVWADPTSDPGLRLFFTGMFGLCLVLWAASTVWRIDYDRDGFTWRSSLGITRRYTYGQITCRRPGRVGDTYCIGRRRLKLESLELEAIRFEAALEAGYRRASGGHPIPVDPRLERDLFRGHIRDPEEIVAAYTLLSVVLAVLLLLFGILNSPDRPEYRQTAVVRGDHWEIEGRDLWLHLTAPEEIRLKIEDFRRVLDSAADPDQLVSDGALQVEYHPYNSRQNESYWLALSVTGKNGRVLVSLDKALAAQRREHRLILGLIAGMLLLILGMFGLTVLAARNPRQHPVLLRLLVRQDSLRL